MSNIEMVQKLSNGINAVENVTIETENGKHDFMMRPLSDGELTRLQVIEKKPYSMTMEFNPNGKRGKTSDNNEMELGMGEFTESQAEALYNAVALSLSVDGEKVTADDIRNMDKGIPELLFNEVIRISTLTEKDLSAVKSFRKF
ncbi:hypothetical protein [Methanobrevibacter sp.]|uniref:hypothetical protein n=1 Tax=Methanobrevibacter sp. TaxID=66852 RepID=UPI0038909DCC